MLKFPNTTSACESLVEAFKAIQERAVAARAAIQEALRRPPTPRAEPTPRAQPTPRAAPTPRAEPTQRPGPTPLADIPTLSGPQPHPPGA